MEIDDALSAALLALSAAQATLRKSLPGRAIDVLTKAHLYTRSQSDFYDAAKVSLRVLDNAERRVARLEAVRDIEEQFKPRRIAPREVEVVSFE
jgi:hypothetical protein